MASTRSGPLCGGRACRRRQRRQPAVRQRSAGSRGVRRARRREGRAICGAQQDREMGRHGRAAASRSHPQSCRAGTPAAALSPGQLMGELKKLMWEQGRRIPQRGLISRRRVIAFARCGVTISTICRSPPKPPTTPACRVVRAAQRPAGGGSRRHRGARPAGKPRRPPARRFSQGGRPLSRQSAAVACTAIELASAFGKVHA